MELNKLLQKKQILIVGGSKDERKKVINTLIEKGNFETFRFPKSMKNIDEYLEFVRVKKLYQPWYSKRSKFGGNQILDFHRDWIRENHSLVVMEEIQQMDEKWKIELLSLYINEVEQHKKGKKFIHLIVSQDKEGDIIENLADQIYSNRKNENRTKRQIVEGNLEIIEI